jgi:hypothetical protein
MPKLTDVVSLFSSESPISFEQKEYQDSYTLSALISTPKAPDAAVLQGLLAAIPERDSFELVFGGASEDVSLTGSSSEACRSFVSEVADALKIISAVADDGEADFTVSLSITKKMVDGILSLYSLESFAQLLTGLDVSQRFSVFGSILYKGKVAFHCLDAGDAFQTKTIYAANTEGAATGVADRKGILEKRDEICHFRNGADHQFIPEDFHLLPRSTCEKFNAVMDGLCFIVSVVYLSDISDIDGNTLSIRLNGYKVISEKVTFPVPFQDSLPELYKLYEWAYSGGNVSDKIGIVRNLISLYAKNSILKVEEGVFSAARSNYEIYLKENIGRYLEIKNNIANKLLEMSQNCTKSIETFGAYFKQSIFAISSFFVTIIVLAAIDKEKYGKVFSTDVKHVALGLIAISFVHMVFTREEYQKKCERFRKEYSYLKESYGDVLDKKDIDRIFDNDKTFNGDYDYLKSELDRYTYCWLVILAILLVLTLYTSSS